MKRRLAALLAALQLLACAVSASAAEWDPTDPNDPLLWEPDLPEFDGPMPSTPRLGETEDAFSIAVSFTGDMLLASLHGKRAAGNFLDYAAKQEPEYFLQHVRPIFEADDFTVVNLENVLTDRNLTPKEKSTDPAYWFRAPAATTDILTSSGVEAVSLANNHTGDYGTAGYKDTVKAVSAAGLECGGNDRTFYLEKNGYRVAVICHGLWTEGQAGTITRRLKAAEKDSDFQVVFYHGGAEGVHTPEAWRVRASRRLIDNGADLVLGNHPHVLQPREVYKG
ncbi:CapA family protein, partial [uncultured Oscillibacter sp.]